VVLGILTTSKLPVEHAIMNGETPVGKNIKINGIKFGHMKEVKEMGRSRSNLIGKTFNRLTVKNLYKINDKSIYYYMCDCNCGNKNIVVNGTYVKNGYTKSCGCLNKEKIKEIGKRNTKHGFLVKPSKSLTRFYNIWKGMRQRCNNSNNWAYKYYGGRGIVYDPRWEEFQNFYDDMYNKYLYTLNVLNIKRPSIERKDVNGNYCKENCIWIPKNEQSKNRRKKETKTKGNKIKNLYFLALSPENKRFLSHNQREFGRKHNLSNSSISLCLNKKYKQYRGWKFIYLKNL
jgi:hypothetical protein